MDLGKLKRSIFYTPCHKEIYISEYQLERLRREADNFSNYRNIFPALPTYFSDYFASLKYVFTCAFGKLGVDPSEDGAAILLVVFSLLLLLAVESTTCDGLALEPTTGGGFRSFHASESPIRVSPASD